MEEYMSMTGILSIKNKIVFEIACESILTMGKGRKQTPNDILSMKILSDILQIIILWEAVHVGVYSNLYKILLDFSRSKQ